MSTQTFEAKMRNVEAAQKELSDAIADERKRLMAARKDIDKQLAHLDTLDGSSSASSRSSGSRAPRGQRQADITNALKGKPAGMSPMDIIKAIGARGNKGAEASIRQAINNMKKAGKLSSAGGVYKLTGA